MKNIRFLPALIVLLLSCQKEPEFQIGTQPNPPASGSDYQPTTANSEWNMKSTSVGEYKIKSLGTDTMVNGVKFFRLDHSIGGRQYISKQNGVYQQLALIPQTGGWTQLLYLKDAAPGTAWTAMVGPVEMRYTIVATGLQRTVNGKLYKEVIHTRYEQYASGMKTATGEQYYAKGIGAIEGVSRIDMMGVQQTIDSTYLVSGIIK